VVSKKVIVAALAGAGILGTVVWSRSFQAPIEVLVAEVELGTVEATVANTRAGTIKACRRSNLSMPAGGIVDRLLVNEGDQVVQGQLLLELWNADYAADLQMAERSYDVAQHEVERACLLADFSMREADRVKTMAARDLVSDESLDTAVTEAASQASICEGLKHQLEVADASRDLHRAVMERTQLRAPFDGVVAEINGEVGEYITPSPPGVPTPPAVDLIDYSCLYVTAPIDEVDAGLLQTGLPARVTLDAFRNLALQGEVTRIAPYVMDFESQARTVDVEVKLVDVPTDISLLVGYSADVTIILEHRDRVLRVPTEALLPDDQMWVVGDLDASGSGVLRLRDLTTGISNWTYTQVLEGLQEGDLVVRNPDSGDLAEGIGAIPVDTYSTVYD
jgi:HlyD family secretion protein